MRSTVRIRCDWVPACPTLKLSCADLLHHLLLDMFYRYQAHSFVHSFNQFCSSHTSCRLCPSLWYHDQMLLPSCQG